MRDLVVIFNRNLNLLTNLSITYVLTYVWIKNQEGRKGKERGIREGKPLDCLGGKEKVKVKVKDAPVSRTRQGPGGGFLS